MPSHHRTPQSLSARRSKNIDLYVYSSVILSVHAARNGSQVHSFHSEATPNSHRKKSLVVGSRSHSILFSIFFCRIFELYIVQRVSSIAMLAHNRKCLHHRFWKVCREWQPALRVLHSRWQLRMALLTLGDWRMRSPRHRSVDFLSSSLSFFLILLPTSQTSFVNHTPGRAVWLE